MNPRDPLIVAMDIGTGSIRGHLMDCNGGIIKTSGRPVQVFVEADGRAEVHPEDRRGSEMVRRKILSRPGRAGSLPDSG